MKHIKLFEDFLIKKESHYDETSWEIEINDKVVKVTIHDVQKFLDDINTPIVEISVNSIKDMCCHLGKTDDKTLKRSEDSNLSYPVIITEDNNGNYGMLLDGHHRLLKAFNNDIEKIKARILYIDEPNVPVEFKELFKK